ncbi:MAG: hypothetical protein ACTSQF_12730 [Candidatus Heimdallarchaeaceae archaeon]
MRIKNILFGILLSILFISSVSVYRNYTVLAAQIGDDFLNPIIVPEVPTYNWTQTSLVSTESVNETAHPSQAVDNEGNVHVIWADTTNYTDSGWDSDIFYKYLNRETGEWSTGEVVSFDSTVDSITPEIAIDQDDRINVVWVEIITNPVAADVIDVYFSYKDENSGEWSLMEQVSTESTGDSYNPSIAVDTTGDVFIVWEDSTDYASCSSDWDIFFKIRSKSSDLWSLTEVLSTESSGDSVQPYIAVDSHRDLHVVWADSTDFGLPDDTILQKIVHKFRESYLLSWSDLKILTKNPASQIQPDFIGQFLFYNYLPIISIDSEDDVHLACYNKEVYDEFHGMLPPEFTYRILYSEIDSTWIKLDPEITPSSEDIVEIVIESIDYLALDNYVIQVYDSIINSRPALSVDIQSNVHLAFPAKFLFFNMRVTISDCIFYVQLNSTNTHVVFTVNATLSSTPTLSTDTKGRINLIWQDYLYHNESDTHLDVFHANCIVAPLPPILNYVSSTYSEVTLNWKGYGFVDKYYVLRDTKMITAYSAYFLDPIAEVTTEYFEETVLAGYEYFYAIIGGNSLANGTISNCLSVDVKLGIIDNFDITFWTFVGIVGVLSVTSIVSISFNIFLRKR